MLKHNRVINCCLTNFKTKCTFSGMFVLYDLFASGFLFVASFDMHAIAAIPDCTLKEKGIWRIFQKSIMRIKPSIVHTFDGVSFFFSICFAMFKGQNRLIFIIDAYIANFHPQWIILLYVQQKNWWTQCVWHTTKALRLTNSLHHHHYHRRHLFVTASPEW